VKESCGDETCEELIVPCGHFAFEAEAVFAGSFSDEVEGDVLDGGEIGGCAAGWLVHETPSQERVLLESEELDNRRQVLGEALTALNRREQRIFEARRLAEKSTTLEKLAEEFGVSREQVPQIEVRAFEKVRKAIRYRFAAVDRR
jgi:RNA polymerase sigma factor (sigma-70 family)